MICDNDKLQLLQNTIKSNNPYVSAKETRFSTPFICIIVKSSTIDGSKLSKCMFLVTWKKNEIRMTNLAIFRAWRNYGLKIYKSEGLTNQNNQAEKCA